jgi:hypothetical protein
MVASKEGYITVWLRHCQPCEPIRPFPFPTGQQFTCIGPVIQRAYYKGPSKQRAFLPPGRGHFNLQGEGILTSRERAF